MYKQLGAKHTFRTIMQGTVTLLILSPHSIFNTPPSCGCILEHLSPCRSYGWAIFSLIFSVFSYLSPSRSPLRTILRSERTRFPPGDRRHVDDGLARRYRRISHMMMVLFDTDPLWQFVIPQTDSDFMPYLDSHICIIPWSVTAMLRYCTMIGTFRWCCVAYKIFKCDTVTSKTGMNRQLGPNCTVILVCSKAKIMLVCMHTKALLSSRNFLISSPVISSTGKTSRCHGKKLTSWHESRKFLERS